MAMPRSFAISIAIAIAIVGFFSGRCAQLDREGLSDDNYKPLVDGAPHERQTGIKKWSGPGDGPSDLLAMLERVTGPLVRYKLALDHMEAWVKRDPRGALDWIKSQQLSARRKEVMRLAIGQYAENDAKGAAEWVLANLSGVDLHNTLIQISSPWSRVNGPEAVAWLSELPESKQRDAALESAFFGWGSVDPISAVAQADNHQDKELASVWRRASYAGWAKSDPVEAVSASLNSSRQHDDMSQFANTLANWATIDLSASADWLQKNVSAPAERADAILELSTIFARQSPDAGLDWIRSLPDEKERQLASNQFAIDWASVDAAASAKWAAEQAPNLLTHEAQKEILMGFLAEDSEAFQQWRNTLPEGPLKDQATKLVVPSEDEEN